MQSTANRPPRGLFLDLDGTLADSLPALRIAYDAFLQGFGKSGNDAEFTRLNGPKLIEIVTELIKSHSLPGAPEELVARYLDLLVGVYARAAVPRRGAAALLEFARRNEAKVALVTSAPRAMAVEFLTIHALDHFFDALVCAEDAQRGKPHPGAYKTALAVCGIAADRATAMEDSPNGVQAAVGAGITTLGIAGAQRRQVLLAAGAAAVFDDFDQARVHIGRIWGLSD